MQLPSKLPSIRQTNSTHLSSHPDIFANYGSIMPTPLKQVLLLIGLLFIFTSCSTTRILTVKPELLHFDTPETSGGFLNGNVTFSAATKTPRYEFGRGTTGNFFGTDTTLGDTEEAVLGDASSLGLSLGLWDRVDIFTRTRGMAGIKIQVLGSPRIKQEEGWKLAISAAAGDYSYVESYDIFPIGASDENSNFYVDGVSSDITVNTGYRFSPRILVYANLFKNQTEVTGFYSNVNTTFRKDRSHEAKGVLIGVNFMSDKHGFATLEFGYARSSWTLLGTNTYTPVGISFGSYW